MIDTAIATVPLWITLAKAVTIPMMAVNLVPLAVWAERRGSALIQNRVGPHRANIMGWSFLGLLHPIADVIKFLTKEPFRPGKAFEPLYSLAPMMVLIPAMMAIAVLPVCDSIPWGEIEIPMSVADLDAGIVYVFAISSLGVFGIALAGWSSNNKFSLLGSLRSTAQMISYELSLGLSVLGILMVFGTLHLNEIARGQGELLFGFLPKWGLVVQPLGFLLFLVAAFAEANRNPFDLPEGESEIVAGYHTEYGGMKFAMFFMAEYVAMVVLSGVIATLYLGGWQIPWLPTETLRETVGPMMTALLQSGALLVKILFFLWLFIWVRWTLPRFRYDQLMRLGWTVILPLAMMNAFVTAGVILYLQVVS